MNYRTLPSSKSKFLIFSPFALIKKIEILTSFRGRYGGPPVEGGVSETLWARIPQMAGGKLSPTRKS
jgi:hypothetical protein